MPAPVVRGTRCKDEQLEHGEPDMGGGRLPLPALFPALVRYGACAIGYNVSTTVFGGTTPLVVTARDA